LIYELLADYLIVRGANPEIKNFRKIKAENGVRKLK